MEKENKPNISSIQIISRILFIPHSGLPQDWHVTEGQHTFITFFYMSKYMVSEDQCHTLSKEHYWNKVYLTGQNLALNCSQVASWFLLCCFKRFRSFDTVNMGSVGQRAPKLPAVKNGGLKKKSAIWPRPLSNQSARVRPRLGSNLSQSLTASNFAALWPTDPIFTASKDLNPLKKCAKSQGCAFCFWVLYGSLKNP